MPPHDELVRRRLPELLEVEALRDQLSAVGTCRREGEVHDGDMVFPLYSFRFGAEDPRAPTLAFVGGVHGLERIGTNVILSYMRTIGETLRWDLSLRRILEHCRLIFLPLVNPIGMFRQRRANGAGVDLMRNAPFEAETKPNIPLVGGHRLSSLLPWYRGPLGAPMEQEAQILVNVIQRELWPASFSLSLDLHSGFGIQDRLWFPYAGSHRPFEDVAQVHALKECLDRSLPHHVYCVEPQSKQYVTHGDLWDYLYVEHRQSHQSGVFLPLCLEMGSWLWVKKNPRQLFSLLGIFNPMLPHRTRRTLRRHASLMDFLLRATASAENWLVQKEGA